MKVIIENSAYVIVMALICLVSIDFILMNMNISRINEIEQYVEDYIEIYGEVGEDDSLTEDTLTQVKYIANKNNMEFGYEYEAQTEKYIYYIIHLKYTLSSSVFRIGKSHCYNGIVRVERGKEIA